jgi:hypothetical protein
MFPQDTFFPKWCFIDAFFNTVALYTSLALDNGRSTQPVMPVLITFFLYMFLNLSIWYNNKFREQIRASRAKKP